MNRLLISILCGLFAAVVGAEEQEVKPTVPARLVSIEVALAEFDASLWPTQDAAAGAGSGGKLLEALRAVENQDKVYSVTQVRLATLENQQAHAQWGERVAVPVGRTFTSGGRTASGGQVGFPSSSTNYSRESLGTLVTAVCRVDESGPIVIELSLEQTRMAADTEVKLDAADPDASALLKPVTRSLKTAVSVPDGQTVVLSGMTTKSGKQQRQDAILVTVRIIGSTPVKGAVRVLELRPRSPAAAAPPPSSGQTADTPAPPSRLPEPTRPQDDRYRRFAEAMHQRYDANGDGKLDAAEFKAYSRAPANADRDGNGIITVEEIVQTLTRAE
jgi:hypothetical protein